MDYLDYVSLVILYLSLATDSSLEETCPKVIGRNPTDLPRRGGNWAHLMTDNTFACAGYVVAWEYFRYRPTGTAYIGIWRIDNDNKYTLIAKTALPPAAAGKIWYEVNPPIPVNESDFIGIHYDKYDLDGIVSDSRGNDGVVTEPELFDTKNTNIFEQDLATGGTIDISQLPNIRSTHALQGHLVAVTCPSPSANVPHPTDCGSF
ncbi:unnamed protein product, partial [Owenia fusiformis]